jgi:hypothetical protein
MLCDITADELKRILAYDPLTGEFRRNSGPRRGYVAGGFDSWGYRQIRIGGRTGPLYLASRLAWLYITGEWPIDQIDHINGDQADDRFANLRQADQSLNTINQRRRSDNTSGITGVSSLRGKWQATIGIGRKFIYLGIYETKEAAAAVYQDAAAALHGNVRRSESLR